MPAFDFALAVRVNLLSSIDDTPATLNGVRDVGLRGTSLVPEATVHRRMLGRQVSLLTSGCAK